MVYKYLGWGKTNENGVAKLDHDADGEPLDHSYTGVGAGEIDVLASLDNPVAEGSIVSEPHTVFDCPVYDGDNTPVSINFSKTNNAVVTDEVVSLIASVLNTNNNPCINIPVVFKQGNTVLGTAYTDCTGDATITQVWEDSDIFDVTATVGENLSEDITMFVKDKDNNVPHNVWLCGDYSHDLNGFIPPVTTDIHFTELDNTHPTNGKYNIKSTRLEPESYYYNLQYHHTITSEYYGKTATLTVDVTSNLSGASSILLGGSSKNYTAIPKGGHGTFSVSYTIPSDMTKLECLIPTFSGPTTGTIYIDNIILKIQ